jgi:glycosyltransferase involved in cell wall biosynthesis
MAPYFVDNKRFGNLATHLRPKRLALRQEFGLPVEGTVFLFVGKLIPKKHPQDLLYAYLSLPLEVRKKVNLLFVGDGVMREKVQKIADGHPNVRIHGFLNQSKIPEVYALSDVLVLPSDSGETWGLAVNEAMASGLPAVVSDHVGCAPDLVLDDKTGFVFPCGDIDSLAEVMKRFVHHPEKVITLGENAKKHVQNFSIERCVIEVVAALKDVV